MSYYTFESVIVNLLLQIGYLPVLIPFYPWISLGHMALNHLSITLLMSYYTFEHVIVKILLHIGCILVISAFSTDHLRFK